MGHSYVQASCYKPVLLTIVLAFKNIISATITIICKINKSLKNTKKHRNARIPYLFYAKSDMGILQLKKRLQSIKKYI